MEEALKLFFETRKKILAYNYAMYVINWDSETEAPPSCFEYRSKQIGVFAEEMHKLQTSQIYYQAVSDLFNNKAQLEKDLQHEITLVKKQIDKINKIPIKDYIDFQMLLAKSQHIWAQAKEKNDYLLFKPTLSEIITYLRKYINYLQTPEVKGYDVLLDQFEPGMKMADYDLFFNELKKRLVPFVKKIISLPKDNFLFANKKYAKNKQKQFCSYLQDVLGFDKRRGLTKESAHPFTTNSGSVDVRFTNHYYENNFTSAIFSAIHEMGHAIYEQQCDPKYDGTFISGGASLGLHESQSRFYENIVGRHELFWQKHYPVLQKHFPRQLKEVPLSTFHRYINKVEASFIRTEADELTYPLHIMVRYEIEKAIFEDNLSLDELENKWNELFYAYFGLQVSEAKLGLLQDIHWSGGAFGYFPTYALGSALSSQILAYLKKDLDFEKIISSSSLNEINLWLKEKIHHHASSKYANEIIYSAFKENFNVNYYIDYLISKYSKIYGL